MTNKEIAKALAELAEKITDSTPDAGIMLVVSMPNDDAIEGDAAPGATAMTIGGNMGRVIAGFTETMMTKAAPRLIFAGIG